MKITNAIETGFTFAAAIRVMEQIGAKHGVMHKHGTYNRMEPTQYRKWELMVMMQSGFGPWVSEPIEEGDPEGYDGHFPPAPEIVTVSWHDVTWGIQIKIKSSSIELHGYWDHAHKAYCSGDSSLDLEFHQALVRIIQEGDWGNDKLPEWSEEQEFMAEADRQMGDMTP